MTYYVRGFCTDGEVPTIGMVLAWAAEHGLELDPPAEMPEFVSWVGEPPPDWGRWTPEELASRDWDGVDLWWRKDWAPMDVSIRDLDGWETEEVTELSPSRQRDQVLGHLARTRFVVSLGLPVSALHDDALWEAVWALLDCFTEHHGALVHIEGGPSTTPRPWRVAWPWTCRRFSRNRRRSSRLPTRRHSPWIRPRERPLTASPNLRSPPATR
jgi:hypothetical protein